VVLVLVVRCFGSSYELSTVLVTGPFLRKWRICCIWKIDEGFLNSVNVQFAASIMCIGDADMLQNS
jgi:hypothetical protein